MRGFGLTDLVTIVVAPREKHSTLPGSLASLFDSIPRDVRVVLCLPRLPDAIREQARSLIRPRGNAELHELEPDVVPHQARARGAELVTTPWLVFVDNDLQYEPCWLDALAKKMVSGEADILAPLIFIGPPAARIIHHAGGLLEISEDAGGHTVVRERHRLMDVDLADAGVQDALRSAEYETCDVAEFHCLAIRTELLRTVLSLPENLITREQQDLALQSRRSGLRVRFVKDSRVTYMARTRFTPDDLRYHAIRWSEERAAQSLDYMESTWGMDFNRSRVLYSWIENHRRRPFRGRVPLLHRLLPRRIEGHYLRKRYGYRV